MQTTLPFSGFYNSLHDGEIDRALEMMFADRATGCHTNDGLQMRAFEACNFSQVHREYARKYCEAFAADFEIALEFDSLDSPREYNFTTDRIFANLTQQEAERIHAATAPEALAAVARERFTSRSGFSSFYSPDVADWGPVAEWDHNQIGALIQAYANQQCNADEFDHWQEYSLCSDFNGSGWLDNWICEATPGIERLFRVHDYLENRAERNA